MYESLFDLVLIIWIITVEARFSILGVRLWKRSK